jgi:hypothetical protein
MNRKIRVMACAGTLLLMGVASSADERVDQVMHVRAGRGGSTEVRRLVVLPTPLLQRVLEDMRQRLAILGQLQAALSIEAYSDAADLAEHHLGMRSLPMHGTLGVAKYMPHGMREMETALHQAASRFAVEARHAGPAVNARPAIAALSEVMQRCVACHTAYRFR